MEMTAAAGANGDGGSHDEAKSVWKTLVSLAARAVKEGEYAELLASNALPTAIVECIELLQARPDPNRLEQVTAVLLHMIEFPAPTHSTRRMPNEDSPHESAATMVAYARDWAIDTLLDLNLQTPSASNAQQPQQAPAPSLLQEKLPLQQLQSSLCTFAAHTSSSFVDELQESIFSAFALQQVHVDNNALTDTLDTCAHCIADDLEFALFADAILASGPRSSVALSPRFLARLFRASAALTANEDALSQASESLVRRQTARAFDQLSAAAMVRVWANDLPSWERQLQEWMLQAHTSPYVPMTSIVWRCTSGAPPEDPVLQSYSYLYVVTIEWFAQHSEWLASPRTLELLNVLSQATRGRADHRAFGRRLVHDLVRMAGAGESADVALWTPRVRAHAFANASSALENLISPSRVTDDDDEFANREHEKGLWATQKQHLREWVGLAERPHILQEALELLFAAPQETSALDGAASTAKLQAARLGAATLLGWFYSSISTASSPPQTIADAALALSSSLVFVDLASASAWLQRSRAQFEKLTLLRIRLVWFWLLKACYAAADSIRNDAAVVEALESIEYAFRRFSPPSAKHRRAFQVEVVTQLLIEIEWRWVVVVQQLGSGDNEHRRRQELQERMDVAVAWLRKIVRLMDIEHRSPAARSASPALAPHLLCAAASSSDAAQLSARLDNVFASN